MPDSFRQRWFPLLPVFLLLAVASNQLRLAFSEGLNPWKGGGFGMFATADRGSLRQVRVYDLTGSGERRVLLPDSVEIERRLAQELPRQANLQGVAQALVREGGDAGSFRVEVWRARFDLESKAWREEKLREAAFDIGPASSAIQRGLPGDGG